MAINLKKKFFQLGWIFQNRKKGQHGIKSELKKGSCKRLVEKKFWKRNFMHGQAE